MSDPIPQKDLDIVMNDIIGIRSEPETMIERFNIVLYSLKGFKKNENTVHFIERFIEELSLMAPLPKMQIDPFLGTVAKLILDASEKKKVNADKFTDEQIQDIVKPLINNYENLNIIYDTHLNSSKYLTKLVLKEDSKGTGFESHNVITLFDETTNLIGAAGRLVGRTGHYLIITIDKYDKIENRTDITKEEFNEFKRIFEMFDIDNDGFITPEEFKEIISKIKFVWPLIGKFGKLLFEKNPAKGAHLNEFIDAILKFGLFENDDVIRRIFDLYCDDAENDTLSLLGLKRIANELETEPHRGDVSLLYKFAVDKNASVTYTEFRAYIKSEVKSGNIVLPKKL